MPAPQNTKYPSSNLSPNYSLISHTTMSRALRTLLAATAILIALYGPPTYHRLRVLGIVPTALPPRVSSSAYEIRTIPNTRHCEDLHHHLKSGLLFTACEGEASPRFDWFPPLAHFDRPEDVPTDGARGGLVIVDPKVRPLPLGKRLADDSQSLEARWLRLDGFKGAFVTHGIDIIDDPTDPTAVYIHAINHAPASPLPASHAPQDIVRSRIEVFRHVLGSDSATHLRSVAHPLVRTPNDIFSISPGELLVTNDHKHRSGPLRTVEDIITHPLGPQTDLIHLRFSLESPDVEASIALDGLHNCNGLGHGPSGQLMLVDASGGILHLGTSSPISLTTSIPFETTIDNPSFYTSVIDSQTGYLNAGLPQAHTLSATARNASSTEPSIVWYLPLNSTTPKVLFHDDGRLLRSASAAVIVDDAVHRDRWLFATGFLSEGIVAMRVAL